MASAYGNNMFSYYTIFNNQRIQVIVHQPDKFINNYKSGNSSPSSGVAMTRNSSIGNFSSGSSTPTLGQGSPGWSTPTLGQSSPHSQKMAEAFSIIKGKVLDAVDNLVNDYSLPKTIQDIQKSPPLFSIINDLLIDETQTKMIKKYFDVEAQEIIYEVNYN
jgi:hypothetical protein